LAYLPIIGLCTRDWIWVTREALAGGFMAGVKHVGHPVIVNKEEHPSKFKVVRPIELLPKGLWDSVIEPRVRRRSLDHVRPCLSVKVGGLIVVLDATPDHCEVINEPAPVVRSRAARPQLKRNLNGGMSNVWSRME